MPANRMKTEVAGTEKVSGSSSAMVSAGPSPGSTPIAVPTNTPPNAQARLIGVSATAKPWPSAARLSIHRFAMSEETLDQTRAQVDRQDLGETQIRDEREREADGDVAQR